MAPDPESLIGRAIAGYRLTRIVGAGGAGTVYLGEQPGETPVAVKILLPSIAVSPPQFEAIRQRFLLEAEVLTRLRHPDILPLLTFGSDTETGLLYMIAPYLSGGTLADRLAHGPLAFEQVSTFITQLAGALDYAHHEGVMHRDLKPSNVLLDAGGHAILADFGIARVVESVGVTAPEANVLFGTPHYMSPEQIQGDNGVITPATDVFGLGVLAYALISGHLPFTGSTPQDIFLAIAEADPVPLHFWRPDVPAAAEATIVRALARDPAARFASAGAFALALEEGLVPAWSADGDRPVMPPATVATSAVAVLPSPYATTLPIAPLIVLTPPPTPSPYDVQPDFWTPPPVPVANRFAPPRQSRGRGGAITLLTLLVVASLGAVAFMRWGGTSLLANLSGHAQPTPTIQPAGLTPYPSPDTPTATLAPTTLPPTATPGPAPTLTPVPPPTATPLPVSTATPLPVARTIVSVGGFVSADDGVRHAVVATSDRMITDFTFTPNGLNPPARLIQMTSPIVAIAGFYTPDDGLRHVIVATQDGAIHEVYYTPATANQVMIGQIAGVTSVGGFYSADDGARHAIIATVTGIVYDIVYKPTTGISAPRKLAQFGTIVSVAGFYTADDHQRHVIVATANGLIHEVYYPVGTGVHQVTIGQVAGPTSIGAFYTSDDGYRHAIVAAQNGTIDEIYYKPSVGISPPVKLTTLSGVIALAGFYTPDNSDRHIIIGTHDGKVSNLYYSAGGGITLVVLGTVG